MFRPDSGPPDINNGGLWFPEYSQLSLFSEHLHIPVPVPERAFHILSHWIPES